MPKLKPQTEPKDQDRIKIKEFAARIDVSYTTAHNMARSKFFWEKGISVKINPSFVKGGVRIIWSKFLEFEKTNPIVAEYLPSSKIEKLRTAYRATG